jgi:hypothetical protein
MTQLISSNLPVFFQCLCVPVNWERARPRFANLAYLINPNLQQDGDLLEAQIVHGTATTFDPWEKRNEFFRLGQGDTEALLAFLRSVGLFERPGLEHSLNRDGTALSVVRATDGETYGVHYLPRTTEKRIWSIRRLLENSLKEPTGWTGKYSDFQVRIVRSAGQARVIVTTTTFLEALLLTLTVDRVQGAKVRKCARPDCGVTFSSMGGHKKKYCNWYCGHIESVRRGRKQKTRERGLVHGK